MKKILSLMLVFAIFTSLLAGCAMGIGDTPAPTQPVVTKPPVAETEPPVDNPDTLYIQGLFYRTVDNTPILLSEDIGPIVLRNDVSDFDDIMDFAIIKAEMEVILESYPCQTTISNWGVTNKATLIDDWKDMIEEMAAMGYAPEKIFFEEEEPAVVELSSTRYDVYAKIMDNIQTDNVLISPLSLNFALGMLSNAAAEEDKSVFAEYFGMKIDEYNEYVANYMQTSNPDRGKTSVEIANGIWVKNNLTLKELYEDTMKSLYNAEVASKNFDVSLIAEINQWISDKTHGMIENVLDEAATRSESILVNTLYFDAEWAEQYEEFQVRDVEFTNANGQATTVSGLYQSGDLNYYENDKATAFMQFYSDRRYAFVGILPKEEGDFTIESLNIAELLDRGPMGDYEVSTMIPKFTFDNSIEMLPLLNAAGLNVGDLAYTEMVNEKPLFVDRVIQNTAIDLNEAGTTAAAVTTVMMMEGAFFEEPKEQKAVILNRPFAFMIYDTETAMPLFIGKVTNL